MTLPFQPPLAPMLAKLKESMPSDEGWLYEPKWDGFRAIVFRDAGEVTIISRDMKPLNRYFPELVSALSAELRENCVIDGEVVIPGSYGLDFEALLLRIHPAESRVKKLAAESPSSFVAFDLLARGSRDLRDEALEDRRKELEDALGGAVHLPRGTTSSGPELETAVIESLAEGPKLALTPQTDDRRLAEVWFEVFEGAGLDGIIAKKNDQRYLPGERAMVKLKHQRTADCVIGGYRLNKTKDGVGSLLLGLYDDSQTLHYVGHTSSFKAPERRALLQELGALEGGTSFGGGRTPGGPSRWTGAQGASWVALEPALVCEVAYDHLQGDRFRHATTFKRWRPEKPPLECTFEQILPAARRR
ncbi:MAG: ATP-dependent DNA ligase [Actinomycetota bacterium]|nr:ATP-dependent DNA ligase [Actinomycetota bacterium]